MKTVFLLMVVLALLVVSGLAQTPDAGSNTDQATITGCLGGSDGNYTIAEEGSRQTLKISTSSVDLKLHLGQDVSLIGHKTSGTASSGRGHTLSPSLPPIAAQRISREWGGRYSDLCAMGVQYCSDSLVNAE